MELSERIKQLRKERGLAQELLAKALGYAPATIGAWESAESLNRPSRTAIIDLADYFDVSTDYLLGRTDIREMAKGGKR